MVLVMVMLMMAMLAMLGSAAAVRTSMDLREAGAERFARASYRVSEAGTMSVLSIATQMQGGFSGFVLAKPDNTLSMTDVGDSVLDLDLKTGSFGREFAVVGAPTFATVVRDSDAAAVPGYDAGRYCFRTYQMLTTAQLGSAAPENQLQAFSFGESKLQSSMTVGPVPCGQ